jgi:hypothetical protein
VYAGRKYADMRRHEGHPYARSGGAIDLVRYVKGYDFKHAVDYLNDRHYNAMRSMLHYGTNSLCAV